MDPVIQQRLDEIDKKLVEIHKSTEKTRKYFLWTLIATLIFFLLPLVGTIIVIPIFIGQMSSLYSGLY